MSAIGGIWSTSTEPARGGLGVLRSAMAHRGPDGQQCWQDGCVGLLHCAMHTTPEARLEKLPYTDSATRLTITFDGRLDNRQELAEHLAVGARAVSMGDGQLVVEAFKRWGEDCPSQLLGDFAFAIWNPLEQQLFCASDHFGVKPFYYTTAPVHGIIAFASDLRALLALPAVSRHPDERRVVDYLLGLPEDEQATFFAAIHRLPPASSMTVKLSGSVSRQYFRFDPEREIRCGSDEEYGESLRAELERAVSCRLRGVGGAAAMLSGGLDSSAIVSLAARAVGAGAGNTPLASVSAVFDELSACDERRYQRAVVERAGTRHAEVYPERCESSRDLDRVLSVLAQPRCVGFHWVMWPVFEWAAAVGARTLLSGYDGDRIVSHGGGWPGELAHSHRWIELARHCLARRGVTWKGRVRMLASEAIQGTIPNSAWAPIARFRSRLRGPDSVAWRVVRPELLRRTGAVARHWAREEQDRQAAVGTRPAHLLLLTSPDRLWDLEFQDVLGAEFGVEPRHPFLDRRVAELCLAMPGDQRWRGGQSRFVLRSALRPLVPELVWSRPRKANFASLSTVSGERLLGPGWEAWWEIDPLESYLDVRGSTWNNLRLRLAAGQLPFDQWRVLWHCLTLGRWLAKVVT